MDAKTRASQLRKPEGKDGIFVGEMMFKGNISFYEKLQDFLVEYPINSLLEVGFGLGKHIPSLFLKEGIKKYIGVDFSETIIEHAQKNFDDKCAFHLMDVNLPQERKFKADMLFTANTVYFCDNLNQVFKNYKHWLVPNGVLIIAKRSQKDLGETLKVITQHGFINYSHQDILKASLNNSFSLLKHISIIDEPFNKEVITQNLHAEFYVFQRT
jgi:SAM-dependent methyltransferase